MEPETERFAAAAAFGAIAGLRCISAPAALSHQLSKRLIQWNRGPVQSVLRDDTVSSILLAAAAGEMVADKLPFTPDRIKPGPLAIRAASGAAVGWAIGRNPESRAFLAFVGATSAIATSFAAYGLRRYLAKHTFLPDALLGLGEDALVVALARNVRIP